MRTGASALAAIAVLAAACGGGGGGTSGQSSSPAQTGGYGAPPSSSAPAPAGGTMVKTANSKFGTILVDDKGMTLYLFEKDTGGKSACSGSCASAWPPLLTSGKPASGAGVNASWLSTTQRSDGKTQVVYHNWPLYHYAGDSKAGDTNGQDLNAFGAKWYVVGAATGEKMEKG